VAVPLLAEWQILSFTEPAIARFKQMKGLRLNVGGSDLCIAAITLENKATLVTRNRRDFQRVPGLILEDWSV
jgi:tRNA(fMet)-specific endonuclease VapC